MGEWEEKLNSILENQDAMGQIMALARSLSGEQGNDGAGLEDGGQEVEPASSHLMDMLGQVDPELIRRGVSIVQGMQRENDHGVALLTALRPLLREEKQGRLDRAMQVLQMTRVFRLAMQAGKEKGGGDV